MAMIVMDTIAVDTIAVNTITMDMITERMKNFLSVLSDNQCLPSVVQGVFYFFFFNPRFLFGITKQKSKQTVTTLNASNQKIT